jgi:hypothetical protein
MVDMNARLFSCQCQDYKLWHHWKPVVCSYNNNENDNNNDNYYTNKDNNKNNNKWICVGLRKCR